MSKREKKKIRKPRLPIEALLRLKGSYAHKTKKRYSRVTEKKKLNETLKNEETDAEGN